MPRLPSAGMAKVGPGTGTGSSGGEGLWAVAASLPILGTTGPVCDPVTENERWSCGGQEQLQPGARPKAPRVGAAARCARALTGERLRPPNQA